MNAGIGADILTEAHQIITGARNQSYGKVTDAYAKVIKMFEVLTGIQLSYADALLFMVSVKLARLSTNLERNQLHHDSLLDALGYLALLNVANQELPANKLVTDRTI
jgi:hypothetical protein